MFNIKTLVAALAFFVAPCLAQAANPPVQIAASISILGDIAAQIGGQVVSVQSLVGPGQDAHTFQPAPDQAKMLSKADLIVINGLRLEGWMDRLIQASGTKAKLTVASAGLKPRQMEDDEAETKGAMVLDPHAWQDPRNGALYARNIAAAIIQLRPEAKEDVEARLKSYLLELKTIDANAHKVFDAVPVAQRKIITSHDAFGYMAAAYGLTVMAPVGLSTEAEPSAADVAKLINQIRKEKVHTVFIENMSDPRLIRQIAKDSGAKVGGELYADSLSPANGDAPSYLALLRHNIKLLGDSLR